MPIRLRAIQLTTACLVVICAAALTACGSPGGTAAPAVSQTAAGPTGSTGATATADATTEQEPATEQEPTAEPSTPVEPASGGSGGQADCPISAADISAVTGFTWEFELYQAARPLESDATITTTVCAFTAGEVVDQFGDPAFLRTDLITGADVARQQATFAANCSEFGGELTTGRVSGGVYCTRNGLTVDGQVGGGDRLVELLVNGGGEDLTAVFDQLLAAAG